MRDRGMGKERGNDEERRTARQRRIDFFSQLLYAVTLHFFGFSFESYVATLLC